LALWPGDACVQHKIIMKVVVVTTGAEESDVLEESQNVVETPGRPLSGFTEEYLQIMNLVLSQQSLGAVLEWCCNSLPNFYQVTSFGSAGMVVIHELHKLKLHVCSS
jgi:hypothetical protein